MHEDAGQAKIIGFVDARTQVLVQQVLQGL